MEWINSDLSENVSVEIRKAATVVIFEYLERCFDEEKLGRPRPLVDAAETHAFNQLIGAIEPLVPDLFSPRYSELITAAKQ